MVLLLACVLAAAVVNPHVSDASELNCPELCDDNVWCLPVLVGVERAAPSGDAPNRALDTGGVEDQRLVLQMMEVRECRCG